MTYEIFKTKFKRYQLVRMPEQFVIDSSSRKQVLSTLKKDIERRKKRELTKA
jgi:hypothetical protein